MAQAGFFIESQQLHNVTAMNRMFLVIFASFSFLAAASLVACQKDDEMHDLSGTVVLELREHAVNGDRQMALYAETREEYPCLNFYIEYSYIKDSDSRHIHFEGVRAPRVCLTAIGPAKAFMGLGKMEEGEHELQFLINEELSISKFLVSEEEVEVKMISASPEFLEFREKVMYRLGDNHAWGYIHAKSSDQEKEIEAFMDELWAMGAIEESLDPANYGFFRITQEAWHFFDHLQEYQPQNPFVFLFEDGFESLTTLADNYSDHFVIVLYDTQGNYYHNQR